VNYDPNLKTSAIARPPETRDAMTMVRDALQAARECGHPLTTVPVNDYGKGYFTGAENFGFKRTTVLEFARMGGLV
jgi:hypothetical protein